MSAIPVRSSRTSTDMTRHRTIFIIALVAATMSACVRTPPPVHVAPTAPLDAPMGVDSSPAGEMYRLLEPCRLRAMQSYADARARFLSGLPARHSMFVVTRLRDAAGRSEQVFIAVDAIEGNRIRGRIWNNVHLAEGYQRGQVVTVPESEVVDWMISRPDGTEEGNWMGRFIDALQATGRPPTGICDPAIDNTV